MGLPDPHRRRIAAIAVGLVAATFAVYARVAGHEFVELDDPVAIVRNPLVRMGLTPASALQAFGIPPDANWIPFTWISLQLGYTLHGLAPAGFLLANVALHALASVLLFVACLRLTSAFWESAFVSAVFALHPLHVESVAWAASRKDVLSGVFFMLTLLGWARFAERPSAARYAAVALWLTCGLLAKTTLVTTPCVLWLLDVWPLRRLAGAPGAAAVARRAAWLLLEKLPLLALAAAASAVALVVQSSVGATVLGTYLAVDSRISNALDAYRIYLAQSVWPSGLTVFYPHPMATLGRARVFAAAALLVALTGLALASLRRRPYLAVGWLWFLGMLVPMLGLVQVGLQAHADRYMYLPLIGLSLALAFAAADLVRAHPVLRVPVAVGGGCALVALALVATRQAGTFRDAIALQERNVAVTEHNVFGHYRLAHALQRVDRLADAEREFGRALALAPDWIDLRLGLADVLVRSDRFEAALVQYRLAAAGAGPERARGKAQALSALRKLAAARANSGDPDGAARLRGIAAQIEDSGTSRDVR